MSYSKETYDFAEKELKRRRENALKQREFNHMTACQKVPEILEVEAEMAKAGLDTIKALGMGSKSADYISSLARISLEAQKKRKALLRSNGFPEDFLDYKFVCQKCEDTGFVEGIACECYKKLLKQTEYNRLCENLPVRSSTFDNFSLEYYPDGEGISPRKRMSNVFKYCREYAEDFSLKSPNLLMYGLTGLGKTHLSLAVAGTAVEKGYGVIYTTAQKLFNTVEAEKFGRAEYNNTEQTICDADLLIIDDLGSEFCTQYTVSVLYNIINSRDLSGKPTIISTNLAPDSIKDNYNDRIASRILNNYTLLYFDGADIRQIKTR